MPHNANDRYPTSLKPLDNSSKDSQFEADIYQMFMDLVEEYIRSDERDLNVGSAPYLGSFDLVSRNVEVDGLSLINNDDEPAMRYLYQAWRARNPKRGLAFVDTYLRLLFGDNAEAYQMWQNKDHPYPEKLNYQDDGNSYLTSRVRVLFKDLLDRSNLTEDIRIINPAIKSSLAAKFILEIHALISADAIRRERIEEFTVESDSDNRKYTANHVLGFNHLPVHVNPQHLQIANASEVNITAEASISPRFILHRNNSLSISNLAHLSQKVSNRY